MPLPEYVQTWLTGFDESSEPVDCSMISLILYTRLAERQTPPDEVKSVFRLLAPLEFHIRPRGGSPWDTYFAPKHEGTNPAGGDSDYPDLAGLDASAVDESVRRRDLHSSTMAGQALAQYHYVRQNYDRAKEATRAYGELKLELTTTMTASIAVHHISDVLEDYRRQGLREDADRVRLLLEERGKGVAAEMKRIWIPIRIDSENVERFTREVLNVDDPYVALFRVAYSTLPNVDLIRGQLDARAEGFLMRHLIPTSITGDNGLPVAVVNTYDDDQHGNLVMETARAMNFDSVYLLNSLDEWKKKFDIEGIQETPDLYDSPLIVEDRIPFFRDGLAAYEAGDYLKAIHVLIPQVENCLRRLLELLNLSPTKSSDEGDGTYELKNMYDCLNEKDVREALEDKLWYFLKALYVDNRGLNLRNVMSHGIAEYEAFNKLNAALVVQSVVLLSIVRPSAVTLAGKKPEETDKEAAEGSSSASDRESGERVS